MERSNQENPTQNNSMILEKQILQEWDKIYPLYKKVIDKLPLAINDMKKRVGWWEENVMKKFVFPLQDSYGKDQCNKNVYFHAISGSGVYYDYGDKKLVKNITGLNDFPGEDSIMDFLKNLNKQLDKKIAAKEQQEASAQEA